MKKVFFKALSIVMVFFVCGSAAFAQTPKPSKESPKDDEWNQTTACPGWNNPAYFQAGEYRGKIGDKSCTSPNVLTGQTGMSFSTTTYPKSQLATVSNGGSSCSSTPSGYSGTTNNAFVIMEGNGTDPNTGTSSVPALPLVPTQFNTNETGIINTNITRSIRIGDVCGGGKAAALYYTFMPTLQNALFYIYYACVVESPGHGTGCDPTFIIRVMRQNNAGNWVQISDTLAYYVTSTPAQQQPAGQPPTPSSTPESGCDTYGSVRLGERGWHLKGSWTSGFLWKDWDKVVLNLSNYANEDSLRIEVLMGDCCWSAHCAYAYIAGECRPLEIKNSGCPAGMSTTVDTLKAPRGMWDYEWYASDYGDADGSIQSFDDFDEGEENGYVTWRSLRAPGTQLNPDGYDPNGYDYLVKPEDFHVTKRRINGVDVAVDSIGNKQWFRCRITSAIDPLKPFDSYLYVDVTNKKPTMGIFSELLCDGTVKMKDIGKVPGGDQSGINVLTDSTKWIFYNDPDCIDQRSDTLVGDTVEYHYDTRDLAGVHVISYASNPDNPSDLSCYSEANFSFRPLQSPKAGMAITKKILCDADETTLSDTTDLTSGDWANNTRFWIFRDSTAAEDDMDLLDTLWGTGSENRVVTRSFTHGVEPIELWVRNGLFYLNPSNVQDTIWCQTQVLDTVAVFQHPELHRDGDSIVCQGEKTKIWVRALGVEGECTYQWSTTYGEVAGGFPPGDMLRVTPYADTSVYYVMVTSPAPAYCVAWDSAYAYLVSPKLKKLDHSGDRTDGRICPGDTAWLMGSNADHYSWTAMPEDPSLVGQEDNDTIVVIPEETTVYTLVGHGTNDCDATPIRDSIVIMPLPVPEVALSPYFIDAENPKLVLRDVSTYGVNSSWLFNDGTTAEGREVTHYFEHSVGRDSVPVTLTSYNVLNCPTVYPFKIPVSTFTAWFPSVFTPGTNDDNSTFRFFTINEYEYFRIDIYNRRGEQVYTSNDLHFEWDGTYKGNPCPQGTYVYTCRYRKPGTPTLSTLTGSITLIR